MNSLISIPGFAGLAVGIVVLIYASVILALYLITVICGWKIFTKMGEPGWKVLIPFYNLYILLKRTSRVRYLWQIIVATVATSVINTLTDNELNIIAKDSTAYYVLLIVSIAILIWDLVVYIKILIGVSKSFGHGGGFAVGLFFLQFIFELILGFGDSEYQGNYLKN